MKALEGAQPFPNFLVYGEKVFSQGQVSLVKSPIWSKIELIRGVLVVLVNSKNEEDPIKKEYFRVVTTFLQL